MIPSHRARGAASLQSSSTLQQRNDFSACSDSELLNLLCASSPPRLHEVIWLLERHQALACAERERQLLEVCRLDDDRLEFAIQHRDAMRRYMQVFRERTAAIQFVRECPLVAYLPTLRSLPSLEAIGMKVRLSILEAGGAKQILSSLPTIDRCIADWQPLANKAQVLCFASPLTASEALLQAALVDLNRFAMRWCCACIGRAAEGTASGLVDVVDMDRIIQHNVASTNAVPAALKHVESLAMLLHIARASATRRVDEEVRAHVSLPIAELLSLFDRILPASVVVPPTERVPPDAPTCSLSGLRLDNRPSTVIDGLSGSVAAAITSYWQRVNSVIG